MRLPIVTRVAAIVFGTAILQPVVTPAQSSDFNLNMHANSHATAKDIGLPVYPGASPFKEKGSDSSSADLGFLFNSFQVSVKAASFVTTDSPEQVLLFYRKPLSKYGEVLECNHGKPVGSLVRTQSGLTCGDHKSGGMTVNGSDDDHQLRAGTPQQFRIVGINHSEDGTTKFGLVALVLPKDNDEK